MIKESQVEVTAPASIAGVRYPGNVTKHQGCLPRLQNLSGRGFLPGLPVSRVAWGFVSFVGSGTCLEIFQLSKSKARHQHMQLLVLSSSSLEIPRCFRKVTSTKSGGRLFPPRNSG